MEIVVHRDPAAFEAVAGALLTADPVGNTVALTVLDGMVRGGHPAELLLTAHRDGEVVAAALRTPGHPVILSAVPPEHAAAVSAAIPDVAAVNGPLQTVQAFARARPESVHIGRLTRLFALDELIPPTGVAGAVRAATAADLPLLGAWRAAFGVDIDEPFATDDEAREHAANSLALGGAELLWEVDGVPVAQATAKPVVAGVSRIGPVYTPPEWRRHGYASAVTAAATRWALDAGAAGVVLFTDLGNETTNRIYPRIGYRAVADSVVARFSSPG
jgi:GNAT superfamily N-acetyltransferase